MLWDLTSQELTKIKGRTYDGKKISGSNYLVNDTSRSASAFFDINAFPFLILYRSLWTPASNFQVRILTFIVWSFITLVLATIVVCLPCRTRVVCVEKIKQNIIWIVVKLVLELFLLGVKQWCHRNNIKICFKDNESLYRKHFNCKKRINNKQFVH